MIGKGNNGGDGLVAARLLRDDGHEVDVLAVAPLDELRGDALANLERLPGAPPEPFDAERLNDSGVIVDALLGTGFEGVPREPLAGAIAAINAQDAPVVACDVPSGVDASTGEVEGEAVRAADDGDLPRLEARPARRARPEPRRAGRGGRDRRPARSPAAPRGGADLGACAATSIPRRGRSGSKFDSGVVVVAGGSAGLTGAPTMAARSASRAGAGYVQVAVPQSAQAAIDMRLLEQMSRGLPEHRGAHTPERRAGGGGDGRASRSGGARPWARPGRGRGRVRPRRGAPASEPRC